MNDRAEECDPPLLAATSAQARPSLQVAEILGPIAGTMIASAAAELGLTVSCQPGLGSDEIITVLSNRSLTLLTALVCGHCVVCMMTRWPGDQVLLPPCQVLPGDCRLPVVSIQWLHSLLVSSVHRSRSPPSLWPRHTAGHHRTLPCTALYSTVQHCTALYSDLITHWAAHRTCPHYTLHTAGTGSCTGTDTAHTQ